MLTRAFNRTVASQLAAAKGPTSSNSRVAPQRSATQARSLSAQVRSWTKMTTSAKQTILSKVETAMTGSSSGKFGNFPSAKQALQAMRSKPTLATAGAVAMFDSVFWWLLVFLLDDGC